MITGDNFLSSASQQYVKLKDSSESNVVYYHLSWISKLNDFENLRTSAHKEHTEEVFFDSSLAQHKWMDVIPTFTSKLILLG